MSFEEKRYSITTTRIAGVLLLFLLLMMLRGAVGDILPIITRDLSAASAEIASELLQAILYALCFLFPTWAFFHWPSFVSAAPLDLTLRVPRRTMCYVFFGMAVISAAAFLNAMLVSVFHYGEFSSEVLWDNEVATNEQLVLMFISLVVVPAFVEELLFRGVIFSNLLPYGKGTAIIGSAVLFGLMHRNIEQILYATVAGVVLAWIYWRTRSIWVCVLTHFLNNFHSLFQRALLSRAPGEMTDMMLYLIQGVLMFLGVWSGVLLFLDKQKCENENDSAEYVLPVSSRVRLFFNVPMIIFVVWCVGNMLFLMMMSFLMY